MPRNNLSALANQNEASVQLRFAQLRDSIAVDEQILLDDLFQSCENRWTISINAWYLPMLFFLETGLPYNKYRHVDHRKNVVFLSPERQVPGESTVDWAGEFWEILQLDPNDAKHAPKRRLFNQWADEEEHFKYGAYYLDGLGASFYGKYLMLFSREAVRDFRFLSFLPHDSLANYVSALEMKVDEEGIRRDLANQRTVTQLMCLKVQNTLQALGLEACKISVCTMDDYLEAQIRDEFTFDDLARVVTTKQTIESLLAINDLNDNGRIHLPEEELTQDERFALYEHKIRSGLGERNVRIIYI